MPKKQRINNSIEAQHIRTAYLASFLYLARLLKDKDLGNQYKQYEFLCREFGISRDSINDIILNGVEDSVRIAALIEIWLTKFKKSDRICKRLDQSLVDVVGSNVLHPTALNKILTEPTSFRVNLIELFASAQAMKMLTDFAPDSAEYWTNTLSLTSTSTVREETFKTGYNPRIQNENEFLDVSRMKIKAICVALHEKHLKEVSDFNLKRMKQLIAKAQNPPQDVKTLFRDLKLRQQDISIVIKNFELSMYFSSEK